VFDLSSFTVNGEVLADSEYIVETDGGAYFAEGELRSRPAFDYLVDGAEAGDTSF